MIVAYRLSLPLRQTFYNSCRFFQRIMGVIKNIASEDNRKAIHLSKSITLLTIPVFLHIFTYTRKHQNSDCNISIKLPTFNDNLAKKKITLPFKSTLVLVGEDDANYSCLSPFSNHSLQYIVVWTGLV
jgi:hypothetical protein